jgi:hypothetical protein
MEEEEKKTSKWAESLGEAGLLDEIEDSWSLPPDRPLEGSTITVKGSAPDMDGAPSEVAATGGDETEPKPSARSVASLPQTPVERRRSSDPEPPPPTAQAPLARPTRPVTKKRPPQAPPAPVSKIPGVKQTMSGIPSAPPVQPEAPNEEPQLIELELVEEESGGPLIELEPVVEASPTTTDQDYAAVVSVRGAHISVPPERPDAVEEAQPEIVDRPPPPLEPEKSARQQIGERYELGDYSGALDIAERLLREDPDDVEASDYAESCKEVLTQMYEARIGSFDRVPQVAVSEHELIWRDLDPAAGFVLSRIDGFSSFEDIIDISGMPRFETCRILDQLLQEGIIK